MWRREPRSPDVTRQKLQEDKMSRASTLFRLFRETRLILLLAAGLCLPGALVHAQQSPGPATDRSEKINGPATAALDLGDCPAIPSNFEQGKTYTCSCPSNQSGGVIYGDGVYTNDSNICVAAIHAGVLPEGVAGRVNLRMVASPSVFKGITQHGVKSEVWPRSTTTAFQLTPGN
jgi:hypothetical protein